MKTFATCNIKGGVGKTSAAVNLAYLAARSGHRTLLWDLDPQAAATYLLRVRPRVKGGGKALIRGTKPLDRAIKGTDFDNLEVLPADFTYRSMDLALDSAKKPLQRIARLLAPLEGEYDLVFLDCPPSMSLVSENVLHAADTLLVPLIPTTLSVRTFRPAHRVHRRLRRPPSRGAGVLLHGRPPQAPAPPDRRATVNRSVRRRGRDHPGPVAGRADDRPPRSRARVRAPEPGRALLRGALGRTAPADLVAPVVDPAIGTAQILRGLAWLPAPGPRQRDGSAARRSIVSPSPSATGWTARAHSAA